jgi:hypothetical protein
MVKTELGGMERQSREPTSIGDLRAVGSEAIYGIAANGMTQIGQMNANLVRTSRFEPARDQRILAEWFDALQVSDREFPAIGNRAATAPAVAAIAH